MTQTAINPDAKNMSAAATGRPRELDPVRRLILEKSQALRLTLADLSRHIRKNESYIHQFMWRGSPKKLPEDVRVALADILEVSEDALRVPSAMAGIPPTFLPGHGAPPQGPAAYVPVRDTMPTPRDIPVFADDDVIDPRRAQEWTYRTPSLITASGAFALWISRARGRMRAGDLVFVRPHQPARVGDTVVMLSTEERRVVAIGDLLEMDATHVKIRDGGDRSHKYPIEGNRMLKVSDISLP